MITWQPAHRDDGLWKYFYHVAIFFSSASTPPWETAAASWLQYFKPNSFTQYKWELTWTPSAPLDSVCLWSCQQSSQVGSVFFLEEVDNVIRASSGFSRSSLKWSYWAVFLCISRKNEFKSAIQFNLWAVLVRLWDGCAQGVLKWPAAQIKAVRD